MSKWEELTDFEINKRVLRIRSGRKSLNYAHKADGRSAGIVDNNKDYHWFDFCNSWADAGRIIQENSIGLEKQTLICCEHCNELYETDEWEASHPTEDIYYSNKNPLRAAMIVFLIMNEGKGNE